MKRRAQALLYFALLISCVLWSGCAGNGSSAPATGTTGQFELLAKPEVPKGVSELHNDDSPDWTWDLIAGQQYYAGTVEVYNDAENMTVVYATSGDWLLQAVHLYAGETPPAKPNPGQFPYKETFNPPVSTHTFVFPLAAVTDQAKGLLYVAAHATLTNGTQSHTAWGGYWNDGDPSWDFEWGNRWGGGFNTNVMPNPELPEGWLTYSGYHFGAYSYWDIVFTGGDENFPPGSFNGPHGRTWAGWCADQAHTMYPGLPYNVQVFSTYDPELPSVAQSDNWDMINYLITQRRNNTGGIYSQNWSDNAVKVEFELALWYFTGGLGAKPGGLAGQFVDDAIANGDDFIPGSGEWYALVLVPDTSTDNNTVRAQMNIIEVDP